MNDIDLKGKSAVVTGGARGIGAAVAQRFVESGARVAIWDFDVSEPDARLATVSRESLEWIELDVSDADAVERAAETTATRLSGIDILVTSAGISGPVAKLWEYPPDAWRRVQSINVDGTFHCCRSVVPYMLSGGYGRMALVSSIAGKEGNPNAAAYAASKAAVIAITKSLGKELAEQDIAVNCITPATAETRILEQVSDEFVEYMLSKIPRGRFVTVEEIASMVAWLCSADNSFTTGAVFDISGGRATY